MIGFLKGTAEFRDDPYVYLNVGNVGYKVLATREVLAASADHTKEIMVYTYTYVREDILELFGFLHVEDLKLFEKFIAISGIGPKTAIQIFSYGTRSEIIEAIIAGNVNFFTAVPRLGRKNAQKIILELKSKFVKGHDALSVIEDASVNDDVLVALRGMGFEISEIQAVIPKLEADDPTEKKIKTALRLLAR